MKSKILHPSSFILGLLLVIAIFVIVYINSSESILLNSTWFLLFNIIFVLNLIPSGYFIFSNSVRTTLSGTGSLLLLFSYLSFVALIIYIFKSIADGFVELLFASVYAPILGVAIGGLNFIGVAILGVAFLKRNNTQKNSGM